MWQSLMIILFQDLFGTSTSKQQHLQGSFPKLSLKENIFVNSWKGFVINSSRNPTCFGLGIPPAAKSLGDLLVFSARWGYSTGMWFFGGLFPTERAVGAHQWGVGVAPQASGEQRGLLSRHGATSRGSGVQEHPGAFGTASSLGTQRVLRVTGLGWGLWAMAPTPAVSLAPWGQLLRVGKVWFPNPPPSLVVASCFQHNAQLC